MNPRNAKRRNERRSAAIMRIMTQRGIPQTEVARILNLAPATVSMKVHGDRRWTADELEILADQWDVSLDVLAGKEPVR